MPHPSPNSADPPNAYPGAQLPGAAHPTPAGTPLSSPADTGSAGAPQGGPSGAGSASAEAPDPATVTGRRTGDTRGNSAMARATNLLRRSRKAPTAQAEGRGPATGPHGQRRWQGRTRLVPAVAGAAAVALAGGVVVAQRSSSAEARYRIATVASRPVDQTLDRVGSIEPVAQASLSFPVDGTVQTVDVAVGDQVTVGQQLTQLDPTSLDAAVADAQATLDAAELTLERALNGEDVGGQLDGGSGGGSAIATPASFSTLSAAGASSAAAPAAQTDDVLAAAQQAVLDAQQQVDTDLAAAQQALDDAQAICASLTAPTNPAPAAETTETTDTTDTTVPADDGNADVAACQSALVAVLDAQHVVATSQDTLADASRALDDLLAERAENPGPTPDPGPGPTTPTTEQPQTGAPTTGPPGTPDDQATPATPQVPSEGTGTGGAGGATASSSPTSAELVAYQKAVDAAAAELAVAEQAAAQATLVSPIAGTVQTVDLAVGDTVTAGASTAAIVVVGDGGYEVTTTVTVDDLPDLAVGQPVTITPDGAAEPATGELVRIGIVGTSSGTATTYPVTIGLTDAPEEALRNGATASLSIVTARSGDAIAVPTSAVSVDGGRATVTVLDDGSPSEVTVQTGAVGDVWTEITDGLDVGQTVVLADLDAPLPTSATDSETTGNFGGPGGLGGGGFPGGPPG